MRKVIDLLKIRPGEGQMTGLVIGLMILTSGGGSIGGTAIEALFYSRFGVNFLPYMYMVLGPTVLLTSLIITGVLGRVRREILYAVLPLILGAVLLAEWLVVTGMHPGWFYPFMWVMMNVLGMLQGLLTWGLAGAACDTRQAKRLFPLFGAGGILGAVIGGFITRPLVTLIGAENLLLVWSGALGLSFILGRLLTRSAAQPRRSRRRPAARAGLLAEIRQGLTYVQRSPLMRWMAFATVLFSILFFSLAFPFNKAAAAQYADTDALAGFLGLFNGLSTGAALVISLIVANRIYARVGIMIAVLALPVIYFAGFGALTLSASFAALVAFRFIQTLWLMGIASPAYQAVFNIVPGERREQTRAFFSGVPEQAGTVIAGLILVVGERILTSQQFYFIGLGVAVITIAVIWRAQRVYGGALVDLLRSGRPQVFFAGDEPFGGFQQDAQAFDAVIAGAVSPDPAVRRVSIEILGNIKAPEAAEQLVGALQDTDPDVRLAGLRGLARAGAADALLDIAVCLDDPEPEVRLGAVEALQVLAHYPHGLASHTSRLLADPAPDVRARAAGILLADGPDSDAESALHAMLADTDPAARVAAVSVFARLARPEDYDLMVAHLSDPGPAVVREAAAGLAQVGGERAARDLVHILSHDDPSVLDSVAKALSAIGEAAMPVIIAALDDPALEEGALLALETAETLSPERALLGYASRSVQRAVHYHNLRRHVELPAGDERRRLLADSIHEKALWHAAHAIRAASLNTRRDTARVALESLTSRDPGQRSSALETLESSVRREIIRPLLPLWEQAEPVPAPPETWLPALLEDGDAWLRACAALTAVGVDHPSVRARLEQMAAADPDLLAREIAAAGLKGNQAMDTLQTLPAVEQILFLRRVPLFMDMSPSDLKRIAGITGERVFGDGDIIAEEGDVGDEMYVIVSGEVSVRVAESGDEKEIARRKSGDVVGEMSIIAREPRIATLMAVGEVRVLVLSQKQFEGILRERPETALAVMKVLIERLKELQAERGADHTAHPGIGSSPQ